MLVSCPVVFKRGIPCYFIFICYHELIRNSLIEIKQFIFVFYVLLQDSDITAAEETLQSRTLLAYICEDVLLAGRTVESLQGRQYTYSVLLNKEGIISLNVIYFSKHVPMWSPWSTSRSNLRSNGQSTPTCTNLQNDGRFGILIELPFQQYHFCEEKFLRYKGSKTVMPIFA